MTKRWHPVWNETREPILRALWLSGSPGSKIAKHFGCTRNAVCGAIHRLGLTRKRKDPAPVYRAKFANAEHPP